MRKISENNGSDEIGLVTPTPGVQADIYFIQWNTTPAHKLNWNNQRNTSPVKYLLPLVYKF